MASTSNFKPSFNPTQYDDDDDFQTPLTQTATVRRKPSKKPKLSGKENIPPPLCFTPKLSVEDCSLDSLPESFDLTAADVTAENEKGYLRNSIESRLIKPRASDSGEGEDFEEIDVLLRLNGVEEEGDGIVEDENGGLVLCPLCGVDISELRNEERELHSNDCLDRLEARPVDGVGIADEARASGRVVEWLRGLGLGKYEEVFVREEVDWDALQWLTEEDLLSIGITTLGPRKKIVHVIAQLREETSSGIEAQTAQQRKRSANGVEVHSDALGGAEVHRMLLNILDKIVLIGFSLTFTWTIIKV